MSHSTKVVPSRDALRALRTLAFSPQAAFAAATGSVCGLVVIHHHQRRKVRLAEKILETKRTIHTLSQGRGNAQANRMFEAAEKGEDFTLHHGRPRRSQRSRLHSTDTAARPEEEDFVFKPWVQLDEYIEEPLGQASSRQFTSLDDTTEDETQHKPLRPKSERDIPAPKVDRVRVDRRLSRPPRTSQEISKTSLLWKTRKFKERIPGHYSDTVEIAKERLRTRWRQRSTKMELEPDQRSDHSNALAEQTFTDLSPVPLVPVAAFDGVVAAMSLGLSTEESVFFNFVFGKPSPDNIFETNVFQALQPWNADVSAGKSRDLESPGENDINRSLTTPAPNAFPDLTSARRDDIRTEDTSTTRLRSRYTPEYAHKQLGSVDLADRYFDALDAVAQAFEAEGVSAAQTSLEHNLILHLSHDRWRELEFQMMLLIDVGQFLTYESFGPVVRRIVRDELSGAVPNLDFVRLLYPGFGYGRSNLLPAKYYYLVQQYLQDYCSSVSEPDDQVSELFKILDASVSFEIPPVEGIVVPVLRQLTNAGYVKRAHELLDTVISNYSIQASFYSTAIIMRGYSVAGEWPKARALMEKAHSQDLSWKKVYGYSDMLGGTIEQYASNYPPEKVYHFVEYCIAEYALLPTSAVSSRLLRVCLRARRYDLVREWILKIQREYNFLSTGINSQTFASEVGLLWRDMNASCKDILASVRALSTGAIEDPFAKTFRGIVSEAVQRDLSLRTKSLEEHTDCRLPERKTIYDIRVLVDDVKELIAHAFKTGFTSRMRLLAEDLIQQVKAVVDIDDLFSGKYEIQEQSAWEERYPTKGSASQASVFARMPHSLRVARLPKVKSIITVVKKAYQSEFELKQKLDQSHFHDVLRYTVDRLEKQARHSDAYTLMEAIYNSKWTKPRGGAPFDVRLFTTWLKIAVTLKSGSKYRAVLWNIVDAGPEVRVTTQLILVARAGAHMTHDSRFRQGHDESIMEVEYLRGRLRRRRYLQGDTMLVLSEWKGLHDDSVERFQELEEQTMVADEAML